jgi:hypothetical protein
MVKLSYADPGRWIADPAAVSLPVGGFSTRPTPLDAGRRSIGARRQTCAFGDPDGDTTGFVVADGRVT